MLINSPIPGRKCQESDWESHKRDCKRQNYLLRVQLSPNYIVDPPIFRTLSCPAKASFEEFHDALQIAFGWASAHCYDFKVSDSSNPYLLRIVDELADDVFEEKESSKVRLFQVFDDPQYRGLPMEYEYDFGDSWSHDIKLVERKDATQFFLCTDGEGHGCAEDVGGPRGWGNLKAAYRASHPTREQQERMKWYEDFASNSDADGLGGGRERVWSKEQINRDLVAWSG